MLKGKKLCIHMQWNHRLIRDRDNLSTRDKIIGPIVSLCLEVLLYSVEYFVGTLNVKVNRVGMYVSKVSQ